MIEKNDPRLTDFVLGELNAAESAEIQSALANSPELSIAVEELRQTVSMLGAAYQAEEPLSLLDDQKAQLAQTREDIATLDKPPTEFNRSTVNRKWIAIALAASLLGVLVGGSYYFSNPPLSPEVAKRMERAEGMSQQELKRAKESVDEADELDFSIDASLSNEVFADLLEPKSSGEKASSEMVFPDADEWRDKRQQRRKFENARPMNESRIDSIELKGGVDIVSGLNLNASGGLAGEDGKNLQGTMGDFAVAPVDQESDSNADQSNDDLDSGLGGMLGGMGGRGFGGGGGRGGMGVPEDGLGGDLGDEEEGGESEQMMRMMQQIAGGDGDVDRGLAPSAPGEQQGEGQPPSRVTGQMGIEADSTELLRKRTEQLMSDASRESLDLGLEEQGRLNVADSLRSTASNDAMPAPTQELGAESKPSNSESFESRMVDKYGRFAPSNEPAPNSRPVEIAKSRGGEPVAEIETDEYEPTLASELPRTVVPAQPGKDFFDETIGGIVVNGSTAESEIPKSDADHAGPARKMPAAAFEPGQPNEIAAKETTDQTKAFIADKKVLEDLGFMVAPVQAGQQDNTRRAQSRLTRPEVRTRSATNENGEMVTESYTVQVPVTESQPSTDSWEVPQIALDIDAQVSEQLITQLAARFDPNQKREFGLEELLENAEKMSTTDLGEGEAEGKDLLLAIKLRELSSSDDEGKRKSEIDATPALAKFGKALQKRNAKVRQTRTWKRVKAIPNTTRLMVGDKDELDLTGMQVNVQVDGFRARVLIDCFYYNDRARQLEGNFKLRLPDDASLYYFAFGESSYDLQPRGGLAAEEFLDDGTQFVSLKADDVRIARQDAWKNVKESRMVPREQAAHAFRETVRRKVDPALVEWSGAGVFNARVFPLAPHKLHRIVIGYDVNLTQVDGNWVYELELPEQSGQCQVDLNLNPIAGVEYSIEPKSDPFEKKANGKLQRRYQFKGPQDGTIRLTASQVPEVLLQSANDKEGEFWGVQLTPELPVQNVAGNSQAIFLLDTSLSSNPDKFNVWLKLLESTLSSNRDSLKQFNVLFFNVDGHFWQDNWVDNTAENTNALIEKCNTLALEGATDLYGAIEKVANADWIYGLANETENPTSGPDLFLLSDGAANWGETNLRLIGRQLQDHQLGSLFAYQTGLTGTSVANLRFLAGESGGAVFSVATEDEIKTAATAHRKRPWKLASINAAGATDIMTAGRVQWVYPGQAITIVGRGTVAEKMKLEFTQAKSTKSLTVSPTKIESELASRLYGQVAVGQLESLGAKVFDVAASYARHFRVTGETCSLLMLESEADYQRFDIQPQEDLFVIKSQLANDYVTKVLKKSAEQLADPKAQLLAWLERLESMPGMSFSMPTALKLAIDDIQVVAVSKPLDCSLTTQDGLSKEYLAEISNERLDYETIATEANRRGGSSVDDAIKVYSSLVERNPGDLVIARDVAFTALELGRPAQAYHLLRSVAVARPFEGSIYPALGQCLMQLGESDMAIVYYEIALGANFNRMGDDFKRIVSAEYMYLLRQIADGRLNSSVKEFAAARLETLKQNLDFESADVLITMMWNTDETDVDLHIFEPSGEECSYENKKTRSGGTITSDITTGFGPEMYANPEAPAGKYDIKVKYFANSQNRTELRNKVHLTIYRGFGTQKEQVTRRTVLLQKVGEKESVATIGVE